MRRIFWKNNVKAGEEMKGLFAKFTALSMTWKIATVSVVCAVLTVAGAAATIVSSQKETEETAGPEVATADDNVSAEESPEEETEKKHVISADSERINELKDNLFAKEEKKDKETTEQKRRKLMQMKMYHLLLLSIMELHQIQKMLKVQMQGDSL